jgi:hypothetical protein
MRTRVPLLLLAVIALAGCGGDAVGDEDPGEIAFDLASESGAAGVRATLTFEGRDRTRVVVDGLDEGEPGGGGPNRAWLYRGTCDDLEEVAQELASIEGPSSETNVQVGLGALMNGDYAIVVGLPDDQPERPLACGEIPQDA